MKAAKDGFPQLLAAWPPTLRLALFHGEDESASRDMAAQLAAKLADPGDPLSITELSPAQLAEDPARLADEAAAISMFGGARVIRVTGAADAITQAVELLLAAPAAGNPVLLIAGDLSKASKLKAAAEAHGHALAFQNYALNADQSGRLAGDRARDLGLKLSRPALRQLIAATNGDRGLIAQELEKFALWLDASPEAPKALEPDHLAALGADSGEAEIDAFVNALLDGDTAAVDRQLTLFAADGTSAIPVLRAMARKLMQLAELRAAMDGGRSAQAAVDAARPPVFWKDKDRTAAQLQRWRTPALAAALDRMLTLERAIKAPQSPGDILAWQGLLGLAARGR
ncbi:DNA polymerase III subunit delta [Sandaracinobacteroides saxicola]|uniref:DNA-directed DNA polymerase n=1 Tax=Sandaracinobacteroides saxicola TaxID=2759707 RepID=A0A7G5IHM0_9SPHN|nr:DNA polymerase III subunit delta [Sandaracinobacteroides saxicola]QMW22862.1 DNA polymerase III subunit delta [Sandaracinobacteroides saxicola]